MCFLTTRGCKARKCLGWRLSRPAMSTDFSHHSEASFTFSCTLSTRALTRSTEPSSTAMLNQTRFFCFLFSFSVLMNKIKKQLWHRRDYRMPYHFTSFQHLELFHFYLKHPQYSLRRYPRMQFSFLFFIYVSTNPFLFSAGSRTFTAAAWSKWLRPSDWAACMPRALPMAWSRRQTMSV